MALALPPFLPPSHKLGIAPAEMTARNEERGGKEDKNRDCGGGRREGGGGEREAASAKMMVMKMTAGKEREGEKESGRGWEIASPVPLLLRSLTVIGRKEAVDIRTYVLD